MSNAQNYPVTQDYGYDPSYPSASHFHTGVDYGCPMQTPVVVNGVQIGLSGNSGYVTGPHLHVGRWIGGNHTNPGIGNGFNFGEAVVTEINEDSTNGKYVRVQGDGASWVYLHLFEQTCSVGQRLTAAVPAPPAPSHSGRYVILPASVQTWAAYHVGSGLRKNTSDQAGTLLPAKYGGLSYEIKTWVGDYGVVINTQAYGDVTIWVKDTDAQFSDSPLDAVSTPAPVPAPTPIPVPAPAAPPVPYLPPAAPVPIPLAPKHTIVYGVKGYETATDAANRSKPASELAAGDYYIYNTYPDKPNLLNLSSVNGKPGAWVDTATDKEPPKPEPVPEPTPQPLPEPTPEPQTQSDTEDEVRATIHWFDPSNHQSGTECKVLKTIMVVEMFNQRPPVTLKADREIKVFGTFVKDGRIYALVRLPADRFFTYLYGIPIHSHTDLSPFLDDIYSFADRIKYGFDRALDSAFKTIDGVVKRKRK